MKISHWKPDGTCYCQADGICCECQKPCNDHDLVGNGDPIVVHWCGDCINKHLDEDEALRLSRNGKKEG